MATVRVAHWTGAGPSATNVDSTGGGSGIKYNNADDNASATTITVPSGTATNFSYYKAMSLNVTATDANNISNRKFYIASAEATGLNVWYAEFNTDTYVQADGTNPADNGSTANATPASSGAFTATGWTAAPESSGAAVTWDASSVSAGSTGKNGQYIVLVLGVSNGPSGGSAIALPTHHFVYDIGP